MNKNLFASFITPMMMGLPIVMMIIMFPTMLFPSTTCLINNRIIAIQQWLIHLTSKQMMAIHNKKGQKWTLMLM